MSSKRLDENGSEVLDSTPVALPVGFKRPESIHDTIRRLIRTERYSRQMEAAGYETLEESDDFDVGDEQEFGVSPWELSADQDENFKRDLADTKKRRANNVQKNSREAPAGHSVSPGAPEVNEKPPAGPIQSP